MIGESHADRPHAFFGKVFESFQDIGGVGEIPLEKCDVNGGSVIALDPGGRARGATQDGEGFFDDVGERGGGRGVISDQ